MSDIDVRLREAGLRVTRPRVVVMEVVHSHPHSDVESIVTRARERITVSRQAVYNVVNALSDAGLLRRVQPPGFPALFEPGTHDSHHHFVCPRCAAILDVPCSVGMPPCFRPDADLGYDIHEAEVVYRGVCPTCRTQQTPAMAGEATPGS